MKTMLLALAAVASAAAATHIHDTLLLNDGVTPMAGTIIVYGPSGAATPATSRTITIGSAGVVDFSLVGCSGCSYRADYRLVNDAGRPTLSFTDTWIVPVSSTTFTRAMLLGGSSAPYYLISQQQVSGAGLAAGQIWYWTGAAWEARTFGAFLSGTGAPSNSLGYDNDFYVRLDAPLSMYGPKAGGVWPTPPVQLAGVPGATGAAGADGRTVLNGTAAPSTEGVNGDFYLRTDTSCLYGPKATGAWPGSCTSLIGPQGGQGAQGYSVLNGTSAPSSGVGVNGDFYLRTDTSCLYGPKATGAWPGSCTSLIGPQGVQGSAAVACNRDVSGTTDTVLTTDNGCSIRYTSASAVTVTVPSGLGALFSTMLVQAGAGQVTPTASGTTITNYQGLTKTSAQGALALLYAPTANAFYLAGGLQ